MAINPTEYLSISRGTIHFGGSSSSASSGEASKTQADKSADNADEDALQSVQLSDDIEESLASVKEKREAYEDAMKQILQSGSLSLSSTGNVQQTSINTATSGSDTSGLAQKFNAKFKGALAGKGGAIVSAAQKYGLDPALLASIMALETGWGTSSAVNNQKNPGGLMDPASNWMKLQSFSSIEEGIEAMARNLKKGYIDQGLTSIEAIGNKYCPVGAANDPNGTNGGWIPSVKSIYSQLA